VLDTTEIAPPAAVDAVRRAHEMGQMQVDNSVRVRLVERTKLLENTINRNNINILVRPASTAPGYGKNHIISLKNDVGLFSRLYMPQQRWESRGILQTRKPSLPPALSDGVGIRLGVKSDLLACLGETSQPKFEAPPTSSIVLDGAVIAQMLKPATAKSFNDYAHQVFEPYILSMFQQAT